MLTVYVRHEPTSDPLTAKYSPCAIDTVVYADQSATIRKGVFQDRRIHRGTKTLTLNCYRWHAEWLPALAKAHNTTKG